MNNALSRVEMLMKARHVWRPSRYIYTCGITIIMLTLMLMMGSNIYNILYILSLYSLHIIYYFIYNAFNTCTSHKQWILSLEIVLVFYIENRIINLSMC